MVVVALRGEEEGGGRRKEEEKEEEQDAATNIKSNNPHLAGGEKTTWTPNLVRRDTGKTTSDYRLFGDALTETCYS